MKIQSTENYGLDRLKILVYGVSGIGKTTLATTIKEPTLIISAESGLLSISGNNIDYVDLSHNDDGTHVQKENRIDRLKEVYEYLQTVECKKKYKWIFIDSLTEISQNLLEKLNAMYPDKKDTLVMYGDNAKVMRALIKSFRDLPYHVVMTALSENDKDDVGRVYTQPSIIGKLAQSLPAFFDEVFFMLATSTGLRQLLTEPGEKVIAKDRSGALEKLEEPDLNTIYLKILSSNAEKIKSAQKLIEEKGSK